MNQQTGSSELTPQAGEYINKIFQRLIVLAPAWKTAIEGNPDAWADMYKAELLTALKEAGVTKGEQISKGVAETRKAGKPFLPAPGEFANNCIGGDKIGLSHNTAAYRIVEKRNLLPAPKASKETGLSELSKIRQAL